jgi:hypothetical protein
VPIPRLHSLFWSSISILGYSSGSDLLLSRRSTSVTSYSLFNQLFDYPFDRLFHLPFNLPLDRYYQLLSI